MSLVSLIFNLLNNTVSNFVETEQYIFFIISMPCLVGEWVVSCIFVLFWSFTYADFSQKKQTKTK